MNTKIASKLILSTLFGISFLAQPTLAQVPGAGGQANSPPVPRVAQPIVNTYAQFTGGGGHGGGGGGYGGFGGGFGVHGRALGIGSGQRASENQWQETCRGGGKTGFQP